MTAVCTCTSEGRCPVCRPPCEWVVDHVGEVPVRCGDDYYTRLGTLAVCVSHFETAMLNRRSVEAVG